MSLFRHVLSPEKVRGEKEVHVVDVEVNVGVTPMLLDLPQLSPAQRSPVQFLCRLLASCVCLLEGTLRPRGRDWSEQSGPDLLGKSFPVLK